MRQDHARSRTCFLVLWLALAPADDAQEPVAIVNCNVLTMSGGRSLPNATVVVRDGVIRELGSGEVAVPESARVIDGEGGWLLPGLTDMHVHIGHESERLLYLRHGVTAGCNLGGDALDLFSGSRLDVLALRDRIRAGELAGPEIYSTGTALDGDPATGPFQTPVPDEDAALRLVDEQLAAGFDFIKVYDALSPSVHAAIVGIARDRGVAVFGHVAEAVGVEATLDSGQTVIAHAEEFFDAYEPVGEDRAANLARLARLTRKARVAVIPNTSFILNVLLQLDDLQARLDRPEVRFVAPSVRRWWEPRDNYLIDRPDPAAFEEQMRAKYDFVHELTIALHDEGVLLLAGSDASVPTAVPGLSLHEELQDLVAAGLTPEQALQTATVNVRTFFAKHLPGQADFGVLEVGARADLLLVARNPLESIEHLEGVRGVMARGRWYTTDDLDGELAKAVDAFER